MKYLILFILVLGMVYPYNSTSNITLNVYPSEDHIELHIQKDGSIEGYIVLIHDGTQVLNEYVKGYSSLKKSYPASPGHYQVNYYDLSEKRIYSKKIEVKEIANPKNQTGVDQYKTYIPKHFGYILFAVSVLLLLYLIYSLVSRRRKRHTRIR